MGFCPEGQIHCDQRCNPATVVIRCNGIPECLDQTDELSCGTKMLPNRSPTMGPSNPDKYSDVITTTVVPTIVGCILLVAAMLAGIKKCKEWESERTEDMRRTRRVVQRITDHLRVKNMQTLDNMRKIRKRRNTLAMRARVEYEQSVAVGQVVNESSPGNQNSLDGETEGITAGITAPPTYAACNASGQSPPPPYEDALVDEYFESLFARAETESQMPAFAWTEEGLRRNMTARSSNGCSRSSSTVMSRRTSRASNHRPRPHTNANMSRSTSSAGGDYQHHPRHRGSTQSHTPIDVNAVIVNVNNRAQTARDRSSLDMTHNRGSRTARM